MLRQGGGRSPEARAKDASSSVEVRRLWAGMAMNFAVFLQQRPRAGAEAQVLYERSLAILESLHQQDAVNAEFALSLAEALLNWGIFLMFNPSRRDEAGPILTRGIAVLTPLAAREPELRRLRHALFALHGARAQWLEGSKQWAEAAQDWRHSAEFATPENRFRMQCQRSAALAQAGQFRQARDLITDLAEHLPPDQPEYPLHLADVLCLCVKGCAASSDLPEEGRAKCQEAWTADAVALLTRHLDMTPAAKREQARKALLTRRELEPLAGHPAFMALTQAAR